MIKGYTLPTYLLMGRFALPTAVIRVRTISLAPVSQDFQVNGDGTVVKASSVATLTFDVFEKEDDLNGGNPIDTRSIFVADVDGDTSYTQCFGTNDATTGAYLAAKASTELGSLFTNATEL